MLALKGEISYIVKDTAEDTSIAGKQLYAEYSWKNQKRGARKVPSPRCIYDNIF